MPICQDSNICVVALLLLPWVVFKRGSAPMEGHETVLMCLGGKANMLAPGLWLVVITFQTEDKYKLFRQD